MSRYEGIDAGPSVLPIDSCRQLIRGALEDAVSEKAALTARVNGGLSDALRKPLYVPYSSDDCRHWPGRPQCVPRL